MEDRPIASLFEVAEKGDPAAASALFATLYAELHRLAKSHLARSSGQLTIGTTSLLHEAYLDIAGRENAFPDHARFLAYAARAMRGLLIDYVRSRNAEKRGGKFEITSLSADSDVAAAEADSLRELSDALDALAAVDPRLAHVVDLRFFCGFSFEEIAAMSNESTRTVERRWEKARVWLHRSLRTKI